MKEPKTVIITGGARGIGFGIGTCFARQHAAVVVADLDEKQAGDAAAQLKDSGAVDAIGLQCDVTDRNTVEAMLKKTTAHFGHVDVLVNNAGICPFKHIMKMTPETWQKTLDVNLTGAYHCTQLAGQQMIDQGAGGRIVFITSLAANVCGPSQVDYAASKGGMHMTMVGFATALGPHGITCNAVAPGMIMTPMTEHHWKKPGPAEEIKQRVPMGRIGYPEDIGHVCVFLASDEAEYVNGIEIRVDGGHQARCA